MNRGTTFGESGYAIADIQLFRDAEGIENLLADFPVFHVATGEVVPAIVDGNALLYVVLKGALTVSMSAAQAEAAMGSRVLPGECVGEFAVLGGERRGVYIAAAEASDVLAIDAATLLRLIDESSGFARKLLAMRVESAYSSIASASSEADADEFDFDSLFNTNSGLLDRSWLDNNLPRMTVEAQRGNASFSILMISLDYLDHFSASFGASKVEEALRLTCEVIVGALRPTDFVARFNEKQLVVLLPAANAQGAMLVARRLYERMRKTAIVAESCEPMQLIASFGIACIAPNQQGDLIGASNAALSRAKGTGHSGISV